MARTTGAWIIIPGYGYPGKLRQRNPEQLYEEWCRRAGRRLDRCVLYVFRCAVHAAAGPSRDPKLMQWWNWKDRPQGRRS